MLNSRNQRYRPLSGSVERLEHRTLLAADLAGALGEQAELLADLNTVPLQMEVITDLTVGDETYFASTSEARVEIWKGDGDSHERLHTLEGNLLAPLVHSNDSVYYAAYVTTDETDNSTHHFSLQVWSVDIATDEVRMEGQLFNTIEGDLSLNRVFLGESNGTLFAALSFYDGGDLLEGELWSNSEGQLTRYSSFALGESGEIKAIQQFGDEFYLEVHERYPFHLEIVDIFRTNPLTRESNAVWRETIWAAAGPGTGPLIEEFEEVPQFAERAYATRPEWTAEASPFETSATQSSNIDWLIPNSTGVTIRMGDELRFTDGTSVEKIWDLDTRRRRYETIEDQGDGYRILDANGQVQRREIESGTFHLHESSISSADMPSRILISDGVGSETVSIDLAEGSEIFERLGSVAGTDLFLSKSGELWSFEPPIQLLEGIRAQDDNALETFTMNNRLWIRGDGLWVSDGSKDGTFRVAELHPEVVYPRHDEVLFFNSQSLWKSDGTNADPTEIPYPPGLGNVWEVAVVNDVMVLLDDTLQLWSSDGTIDGTQLLRQFDRRPSDFMLVDNSLVFAVGSDPGRGIPVEDGELWTTTGSPESTMLLQKFQHGPRDFTSHDDTLFFVAGDALGIELWMTDGTESGTQLAADVFPGPSSSRPEHLTVSNDSLLFVADDGIHGRELWKVDLSKQADQPSSLLPGDTNDDGIVNFVDFLLLSNNFGEETDEGHRSGDFTGDGRVDFDDFLILSRNYNREA